MIDTVLLLIDFGVMVLIWLVQIIIYPSFQYYSSSDLIRWHQQYTTRITFFVFPLMVSQLIGHAWLLWQQGSLINIVIMALISMAWLVTFLIEVPYHNLIARGEQPKLNIVRLIRWNWPRTVLWSVIFILQLNQCYLLDNIALDQSSITMSLRLF